jgi:hypothetical protein
VAERTCSHHGCPKPHRSHGWCAMHYWRWQHALDMDAPVRGSVTVCIYPDCSGRVVANGWCNLHYRRLKNGVALDAPRRVINRRPGVLRPPGVSPVDWFWQGFKRDEQTGCMEWQRAKVAKGYGACAEEVGSGSGDAHVEAWVLTNGHVPQGLYVCHTCDNPPCGEPTHLWVGTAADNNKDKAEKGRAVRGEAHPKSRLTATQVRDIRIRLAAGESMNSIARLYGVSHPAIKAIATGKTWKHLS